MGEKLDLIVSEEYHQVRIDKYLNEMLPDMSRSYLQKIIKDNGVYVDSKLVKSNHKVALGQKVEIVIPEAVSLDIEAENIPLDIIYEDNDIILVNKPKNMVVHPSVGHYSKTLVNALLYHSKGNLSAINGVLRPGIVHRIDKDTTGILIVCKNDMAHQSLSKQLKNHSITRKYHAIVYNNFIADEGTINVPIGRRQNDRKKMGINQSQGKPAVTHYKVLERFGKYTYIECSLETGRTHQIRVHMASIGHPLLGDTVYGPTKDSFKLEGQTLHAKTLGFVHPVTDEYLEFEAPLPDYFINLLANLKKS